MLKIKNTLSFLILICGLLICLAAPAKLSAQEIAAVPVYRLYGALNCLGGGCGAYVDEFQQHLYTTDQALRDKISALDRQPVYKVEGVEYYVLPKQISGTVPFYKYQRSYKPDGSGDTSNLLKHQQRKQFFQTKSEKIKNYTLSPQPFGYVSTVKTADTVPLYRLYRPYKSGKLTREEDHFYTTSETEKNNAVKTHGYTDEGVACYVWKSAVKYGANGKPVAGSSSSNSDKPTKEIIENAFRDVYGYPVTAERFAFWSAQTADYAKIVAAESKRQNAEPLARKLMIARVYKDTFGRVANKNEMDFWLPKVEYYKQIFNASRAYLYAPGGAKDLTETVKRALTSKNGKTPLDEEVKTAMSKYRYTRAIYDEM